MPSPYDPSATDTPPDPTNPAARRPLQPGEADLGAKELEALNWSKQHAPSDPNGQQILAAQYIYKKYGILPNNGQGDWQHAGGGPLGWQMVNGDLVPKDRNWWDKYGMLAVSAGILTAGTASAFLSGAPAVAGGSGAAGANAGAGAAVPAVAGSTLPAATYGAGGAVTNFAASPAIAGAAGTPMLESILHYGVPTAGNLVGGIIQANASGKASDAQQRYLEEALAYQKEQDAYNRKTAAEHYDYSKNTEASRYGDYTNNIAGYVATGNSANARMASLLGLPPNAPMTGSSMPKVGAASVPAVTGVAPSPGVTTQPQARTNEPMVTMQGPDGSQKQVPSSQVEHYKQIGATVIGQAA